MVSHETTDLPGAVTWASRLLIWLGVLVAINGAVAAAGRSGTTGADISFAVLLLLTTGVCARGLRRHARWAWFAALALAAGALFFVAPVAGTILLGGGVEPVGTGWDIVYFPALALTLVALLVLLRSAWPAMRAGP